MINRFPIVGVMGSRADRHEEFSVPLGRLLAEEGYNLLTGGGQGTMLAVSQAFASVWPREGRTIGILPTIQNEDGTVSLKEGFPNEAVEIPIITSLGVHKPDNAPGTMTRNEINVLTSDALVFLRGSVGTLNEFALAKKHNKPSICFGSPSALEIFPNDAVKTADLSVVKSFLQDYLSQSAGRQRRQANG